ncbi:MAG TPA: hypothetical protein VJS43_07430 [Candidatus Acidoferrales bacterium]|nr:hypothetical protein [Candidatus Acidoferrales bacterium]
MDREKQRFAPAITSRAPVFDMVKREYPKRQTPDIRVRAVAASGE